VFLIRENTRMGREAAWHLSPESVNNGGILHAYG
jgi:hypothetical protein